MSDENKPFEFDTMVVVLYAMAESGVTLGTKHYQIMSAVDPRGRGPDSFQHQFRKVKARAKELQDKAKKGELGTPVKKSRGRTAAASLAKTPKSSTKRPRKALLEEENGGDDHDDDEESPSKKVKAELDTVEYYAEDGEMV